MFTKSKHIYKQLQELIYDFDSALERKLQIGISTGKRGTKDMHYYHRSTKDEFHIIALAHYDGNTPAPEIEIIVDTELKTAEAIGIHDRYGFEEVCPEEGCPDMILQEKLNQFLITWLADCIKHRHRIEFPDRDREQGKNDRSISREERSENNDHDKSIDR